MKEQFKLYVVWCIKKGLKPSHGNSLKQYIEAIK